MKFKLDIDCDNAAFDDDFYGELQRILLDVRGDIRYLVGRPGRMEDGNIRDSNGNTIGKWELVDD